MLKLLQILQINSDQKRLEAAAKNFFGSLPDHIIKLKGDASNRRIYRITHGHTSVIAVCGQNRAENDAFVNFSYHFLAHKCPVPQVYLYLSDKGIYFCQDLGDTTLYNHIKNMGLGLESEKIKNIYNIIIKYLLEFQISAGRTIDYNYLFSANYSFLITSCWQNWKGWHIIYHYPGENFFFIEIFNHGILCCGIIIIIFSIINPDEKELCSMILVHCSSTFRMDYVKRVVTIS